MSNRLRIVGVILFVIAVIAGVGIYKGVVQEEKSELYTTNLDIESLKKQKKPILVAFTADWCIPCRTFNPLLEKTYESLGDQVIIKIVDVDKSPEIVSKFPVKAIPTQVVYPVNGSDFVLDETASLLGFSIYEKSDGSGEEIITHEGAMSEAQLLSLLEGIGVD